jgi:hypothetical protein
MHLTHNWKTKIALKFQNVDILANVFTLTKIKYILSIVARIHVLVDFVKNLANLAY